MVEDDHEGDDEVAMPQVGARGDAEDVVLRLPLPEAMQGPRQRRRPPREQQLVAAENLDATHDGDLPRGRRHTRPPDFLGIEKDRDGHGARLDLSPPLAAQLLELPPSLAERMLTPTAQTPSSSCSPTPLATPQITPVPTPETSPDTSVVAPPNRFSGHSHTWLGTEHILHGGDREDVLERHRHWSIGGGETDQNCPYPMLDWAPRPPPPSC